MKIYYYNLYGLGIQSTLFFPELIAKDIFPDVKIYFNDYNSIYSLKNFKEVNYGNLLRIQYNSDESIVIFDNEPILKVKNGKEIIVNSETNLYDNFLRALILSQGMGLILQQREYLVLHANSVKMNDNAVVFVGSSGNGKSTLTLALNNNGYPLVADDILAVKFYDNDFKVFPGFPRIKLWQDTIESLTDASDSIYKIHPKSQKFSYSTKKKFSFEPLPLKKIYILEKSKKNEIIDLKPQQALINLIEESYNFKMFNDTEKSHNLFQCASLLKKVHVSILRTHQSINEINDLVKLIEKNIFD